LNFLLKRSSIVPGDAVHCERLDPFVEILMNFLSSSHVTLITASIRSLLWIVKFPMKCLDGKKILEITEKVFGLLNKFGGGTDCKGENHDLVVIASKLLVVLIRDVELTQLSEMHLKTVFEYVSIDVLDPLKATTAFGLLTAVIGRKLHSPELHDIILKIMELSIQSSSSQTRTAARSVVVAYVSNYNLKKKLGKVFEFFVGQLNYELEFGRLSACEMLRSLIATLGSGKIEHQATFLFFGLSPQLVNEESPTCKKLVATTIGSLLSHCSQGTITKLLNSVLIWFQEENPGHCQLACHLLSIFNESLELKILKPHVEVILKKLPEHIVGETDHLSIQALNFALKLLSKDTEMDLFYIFSDQCISLWKGVHSSLLHSHSWIRTMSSQLIGIYLCQISSETIVDNVLNGSSTWLADIESIKTLILDLIEQISLLEEADSEFGTQILKNLVALTKVTTQPKWFKVVQEGEVKVEFSWIIKKATKVANRELVTSPKLTVKRFSIFNFIAATVLDLPEDKLVSVLSIILPPLQREVTSNQNNSELKAHCQEILDLIKSKVDDDVFNPTYMEIQLNLSKKRTEKKNAIKQTLILNPEKAAKRKIQQNESKKRAKKAKFKNK